MVETSELSQREASLRRSGVNAADEVLHAWFIGDVLSLEAVLMQFLRNNWRNESEVEDLCQDVYLRAYKAATEQGIPERTKPFVFTIARNLLIDLVRKGQVVPIEAMVELERLEVAGDAPSVEQSIIAGEELRRLRSALDQLPPRCREVVLLTRMEGLTRQQIATRMGISDRTVAKHLEIGMRVLANALYRTAVKAQ
jgi:RNA polymerase sigma factor (sigma-70 family)